jgi:hypothetical protein
MDLLFWLVGFCLAVVLLFVAAARTATTSGSLGARSSNPRNARFLTAGVDSSRSHRSWSI